MDLLRRFPQIESEWCLAEVEVDRGVRVEPHDRMERQLIRLGDEGRAYELSVLGEEDASRSDRDSTANDVTVPEAWAEGPRAIPAPMENMAIVRVVAE